MMTIARQESHILNENSIDTNLGELVEQAVGVVQLLVVDDGIDGDVDLGPKRMGKAAEFGNIGHAVARSSARTKSRSADVDGIRTVIDGGFAAFQVLGRSQQFKLYHPYLLSLIYHLISSILNGVS